MTDDRADTAPLADRERIARMLVLAHFEADRTNWDQRLGWEQELFRRRADAVLAALPTPAEYVAGLADDETLVERTVRVMYDGLDGPPPPREARVLIEASIEDVLRALAAALTERTDRG